MKPISKLAMYKSATNSEQLLKLFLKLTNNPKRHIRGPMYSNLPGNGKKYQLEGWGKDTEAVSGCALGLFNLLTADGAHLMRTQTQIRLSGTAARLYPDNPSFIDVSDSLGLRAIRRVVKETLKTL